MNWVLSVPTDPEQRHFRPPPATRPGTKRAMVRDILQRRGMPMNVDEILRELRESPSPASRERLRKLLCGLVEKRILSREADRSYALNEGAPIVPK